MKYKQKGMTKERTSQVNLVSVLLIINEVWSLKMKGIKLNYFYQKMNKAWGR